MKRVLRTVWMFVSAATLGLAVTASADEVGWPGASYDPAIPSHQDVLGYAAGERISTPEDLARYLEVLSEAAPARTRLVEYARSWEGRPLYYLVIGTAANIARLESIKAGMQHLADPRGLSAAAAEALMAELPALVWLAHGVHGNEISSPEAALVTAHHLLAADAGGRLLEETVVIIDPLENPDGRARFVQHYRSLFGLEAQGSAIAAERVEGWPSGRTNHYLFDMNRDWFALTQPEVAGRVGAFLEYYPLVYVDLHEMGTDRTFYFPPPALPYNPYLSPRQLAAYDGFGRHTGSRFDEFGFRYFTRETYDAYYPGYGDTWPTLQGALGMTFEMASARGLKGERSDGTIVTYSDGVQRHFVASIATIETAAADRQRLLGDFLAFRRNSDVADGYVLARRGDVGRVDKLAQLLTAQGIEVRRLEVAARICGATQPAGSYLISGSQPAGRLASTLLAADSPLDEAFWAEQERRREKGLPGQVYDIIAWSLPALWGVEVASCRLRDQQAPLASFPAPAPYPAPARAQVAYLVPWGSQAAVKALSQALLAGLVLASSDEPFTQNGRTYPRGTLVVRVAGNGDSVHEHMREISSSSGAEIVATDSSWVDDGVNFGSDKVRNVPPVRLALAWGAPVSPYSVGALRYVFEQKFGYPVTPVRTTSLSSPHLAEFDVLVLPSGSGYDGEISDDARQNIQHWVEAGGVLLAVGGALELLTRDALGLLDTLPERRAQEENGNGSANGGSDEDAEEAASHASGTVLDDPAALKEALAPLEENPPEILGAILRASVDGEHWLGAGMPPGVSLVVQGERVYSPLRRDKGANVVRFAAADELVAAGHLWEASRSQWAQKPAVMAARKGRGIVVGFTFDPAFRGYLDGVDVLLANAAFRGAAQARPVR